MALVKGIEKVVAAEGFDLSFLKAKIKELNDAGILENKVKTVAVSKPVMVDSFLKAIEAIPEGSAEEKAIPKDVTVLYNAYVDVLEDKVLAIPVVVKEIVSEGTEGKKEKVTRNGIEKDEFGFRIGSKMNLFAKAISEKSLTMGEVKELPWNEKKATYFGTFSKLKKEGKAAIDENKKMFVVK